MEIIEQTCLRLPKEKLRILRIVAGMENKPMCRIIEESLNEYFKKLDVPKKMKNLI